MTEDLFEKFGLEVKNQSAQSVEVGETYPIYGSITKFITENIGNVEVVVNNNLKVQIVLQDDFETKLNTLKKRAFDPGVFILKIIEKYETDSEYTALGVCSSVIFGKQDKNLMV